MEKEKRRKHFRVAIFGSARIEKEDPIFLQVYSLAKKIGEEGMDIVTGGGPGLMNAASEGHHAGRRDTKAHSVGLRISLPMEEVESFHLDIKKEFKRFSHRLDGFMGISDAVVVASGGVGTLLELFYTWQLIQVKHMQDIPIVLLGDMWIDLVRWIKEWPLRLGLLNVEDVELLFATSDYKEAFAVIKKAYDTSTHT